MFLIYAVFYNNPKHWPELNKPSEGIFGKEVFRQSYGPVVALFLGKKLFAFLLTVQSWVGSVSGITFLPHVVPIKCFVYCVVCNLCSMTRHFFLITGVHRGHLKISISKMNHMCLVLRNAEGKKGDTGKAVEEFKWMRGDSTSGRWHKALAV